MENTNIITVGGMGSSQLTEEVSYYQEQCVNSVVTDAGERNAYKKDIVSIYNLNKRDKNVLIGHSFGGQAVAEACDSISDVDLLVLIDPVPQNGEELKISPAVKKVFVFYASFDTPLIKDRAIVNVNGTEVRTQIIQGGHNTIPHDEEMKAFIANEINLISLSEETEEPTEPETPPTEPPAITIPPGSSVFIVNGTITQIR